MASEFGGQESTVTTMPATVSKMANAVGDAQPSHDTAIRALLDRLRPDSYLAGNQSHAAIDDLLSAVVSELALGARIELAQCVSADPGALGKTARELSLDDISVAAPVLENCEALTEETLLEVIARTSQAHMLALTKRKSISEKVSDALVDRGEDGVVASLLGNPGANIAYGTYEKVAVRAQESPLLQNPLIARESVPLDLLNELYFKAEGDFRRQILARFDSAATYELSLALLQNRRRWLVRHGGLPDDFETVRAEIDKLDRSGELKPPILVRLLRDRRPTAFKLSFAKLTHTGYELINRIVERKDYEALAMAARVANFDRALFVTLALLISGDDQRMARAEEFGRLYEEMPAELAHKVLCLWKTGLDNGNPGEPGR
jgi:uncharacterized protein (DUF2336 family)